MMSPTDSICQPLATVSRGRLLYIPTKAEKKGGSCSYDSETRSRHELMIRDSQNITNHGFPNNLNRVYISSSEPAFHRASTQHMYVFAHTTPKCLSLVKLQDNLPAGFIYMSEVQCLNHEVCLSTKANWSIYDKEVPPVRHLVAEVRPRWQLDANGLTISCKVIDKAFRAFAWETCVSQFERFVITLDDVEFVMRIVECYGEDTDGGLEEAYWGLLNDETEVFLYKDTSQFAPEWTLSDCCERSAASAVDKSIVLIETADGEVFPVKKRLLQPCIALASAVIDRRDSQTCASVDIDCLTFDRVLLYLEAERDGNGESFDIREDHVQAMLKAGEHLACVGLVDLCKARLGDFETRVRKVAIPFSEIVERNNAGEVLLVVDGMVLDVTRWLKYHPGGQAVIPQALNIDSVAMFEMYHASRLSFRFLRQFYIGEIRPSDRDKISDKEGYMPSSGFLEQLRHFTTWRVEPEEQTRVHLGVR